MKVTQEIIDRILEVVDDKGLSRAEFSKRLAYEPNKISEIANKYTKNLSNSFVNAMKREFNVNLKWLETGIGEKYIPEESIKDPEVRRLVDNYYHCALHYRKRLVEDSDFYRMRSKLETGHLYVAEKKISYGEKKKPKD